jgi:WhiB family transcriptional regulator, redox-sensing transcriptional regulator
MTPMLIDNWWREAACRNAEPELFFPVSATSASAPAIRRAKAICATCPVSTQCLTYALTHRQEQGIWGGLTDEERRSVRAETAKLDRRRSSARAALLGDRIDQLTP